MADALTSKHCVPCEGGIPALTPAEIAPLLAQLDGWTVQDGNKVTKSYTFPDFVQALAFVNRAGAVAEEEGHHPDLFLTWGKVGVELTTHAIGGLSENDFILAAKLDEVLSAT
ncbi:MAG: 4a-hydroxytetrahydrobiopterin dehydratase [Chloroflexota bacterium]